MKHRDDYESYLFRFRRIHRGEQAAWLASTQSARTGEMRWFASLDALIAYLRAEFGEDLTTEGSGDEGAHLH